MDPLIDSVPANRKGNPTVKVRATGPGRSELGLQIELVGDEIALAGTLSCRLAAEY